MLACGDMQQVREEEAFSKAASCVHVPNGQVIVRVQVELHRAEQRVSGLVRCDVGRVNRAGVTRP